MGDTPLHFAASVFAKSFIWDLLTHNGADPTIRNMAGKTPADIAAQNQLIT
jgi:ankyrin repeat protein